MLARSSCNDRRFDITLADPTRRNPLGEAMFTALHERLLVAAVACDDRLLGADGLPKGADAVVIRAGFDRAARVDRPAPIADLVHELARTVQALRKLPVPVVASVPGAALAGGCAVLAGCDFVVVAPDAQIGYPVHRIGVSPAVSLPALTAGAGHGRARAITLGGDVVDGPNAVRLGLATHCAATPDALDAETDRLVANILSKGPHALRATKAWLNELDGSVDEARHLHAEMASAAAADGDEFASMLRAFWATRKQAVTPR